MARKCARNADPCGGGIIATVRTVKVNGRKIATVPNAVQSHGDDEHSSARMVTGSRNVKAQGKRVCRSKDSASCGHRVSRGSPNVQVN